MFLTLALGRRENSLTEMSVWMLCFPQKRVTCNYNLSFLACGASCDTRDGLFWLWQQLWCRGTVINVIHQLAFPIQIPIPAVQMQLGSWGGQEEGSTEHGLDLIHSIPLNFHLLPGGRMILDLLNKGFLVAVPVSVSGRAVHGSTSQTLFRIPDIFNCLFHLTTLPLEKILTLFCLQNRNISGQEIVPPTAATYMLLSATRFYGFYYVCL